MTTPQPVPTNFAFVGVVWPSLLIECRRAEQSALSDPRASGFQARRVLEQVVKHIYDFRGLRIPERSDLSGLLRDHTFRAPVPDVIQDKMRIIRQRGNDAVHGDGHFSADLSVQVLKHLYDVLKWAAATYSSQGASLPLRQPFDQGILQRGPQVKAQSHAQLKKLAAELEKRDAALAKERADREAAYLLLSEAEAAQLKREEQHARERTLFEQRALEAEAARAATEQEKALALEAKERQAAELQRQLDEARAALRDKQVQEHERTGSVDTTVDLAVDEETTRREIIDPMLAAAGFSTTAGNLKAEYPVTGLEISNQNSQGKGRADYVLLGDDGLPLAIVEAKRTSRSHHDGIEQARGYADALEEKYGRRPLIYVTNGHQVWMWDDAANLPGSGSGYPAREVEGYGTASELEGLIRRRTTRKLLNTITVDESIAGRDYQQRAIRAVTERLAEGHRRSLVVMATGTGKTRLAVALVKLLKQAGWVQSVLFLADRKALVGQAHDTFTALYADSAPVNLLDDRWGEGQVYVSTYQTMIDMLGDPEEGKRVFSVNDFDLIIVDEAHRSVYNRYRRIFEYFDSYLLGLTATPKSDIDHNTYQLFNVTDGEPTFAYGLDQAIEEKHLVPYRAFAGATKFLRRGFRFDELPDDAQETLSAEDWGTDENGAPRNVPEAVTPAEINAKLYNRDTIRQVLQQVAEHGIRVEGADRLGKTIIFARNQRHAGYIKEEYDKLFPASSNSEAAVITHSVDGADKLIKRFKQHGAGKSGNQIDVAISVDMLDTGVDVPAVVNLVFFKPVYSPVKFWQMMGRGTRLCKDLFGPGRDKREFFVFDYGGNLEFFSADDAPEFTSSGQKSLSERIFNRRAEIVHRLDANRGDSHVEDALRESLVSYLRDDVNGIPEDSILVRPANRSALNRFRANTAWEVINAEELQTLTDHIAGLPLPSASDEETAKRFDFLILGIQQKILEGLGDWASDRNKVQDIAQNLLTRKSIPDVAAQLGLLDRVLIDDWWENVTIGELELVRKRIRGLVRLLDKGHRKAVTVDIQDELGDLAEIQLDAAAAGGTVTASLAEIKLKAVLEKHKDSIALSKLRTARPITAVDADALEAMVSEAGVEGEGLNDLRDRLTGDSIPEFLRRLVGLDESAVREEFNEFLTGTTLNSNQLGFIQTMVKYLTDNGVLQFDELYNPPFTDHGQVVDLFEPTELKGFIRTLDAINSSAKPEETDPATG